MTSLLVVLLEHRIVIFMVKTQGLAYIGCTSDLVEDIVLGTQSFLQGEYLRSLI
jgi:hypothetical protein